MNSTLLPCCLVSSLVLIGGVARAQGADSCSLPAPISGTGSFAFDNTAATTGTEGQADLLCLDPTGTTGISLDVWFEWVATATAPFRFETCGGTSIDTKIAVYDGTSCPASGPLACNDDTCSVQSRVEFNATLGQSYVLRLGNWSASAPGNGTFALTEVVPPTLPDGCAAPEAITGASTFAFDNTLATTGVEGQNESLCLDSGGFTAIARDLWYTWTAPVTGDYTFTTCALTSVDTKVAVWAGVGCPPGLVLLGCNDDSCFQQSEVHFAATGGAAYTIQLGTWLNSPPGAGLFRLELRLPPTPSDDCTTPEVVAGTGFFPFDNTAATTGSSGQGEPGCLDAGGYTGIANDLWFRWIAPTSDDYAVSTCVGTFIDTKLAVWAGAGCPPGVPSSLGSGLVLLGCNDDACFTQSRVAFPTTAGATYTIQLGNWPTAVPGTGLFSIEPFNAPPPCGTEKGPDVIVGDLQEIENYPTSGVVDAISLGTTSCNVGTSNLSWIASTNQHPAIGGNLYRYRVVDGSGRFEQIGMSWLKHGFFALSQNLCCPNCQATSGSELGVGCSDPYSAGRNGSQFGLGPRWQVNPHTGQFPFPPADPGFSGTTARRLEYLASDADPSPGARYFGEAQYVTPDDAAAGNQDNNASYRELSLNPATLDFGLLGQTQRGKAAIEAWAAIDPEVTLTRVQVPGDGLFLVGSRATPLQGGRYHYEYAVYNMNADRAGGSFSIPLAGGVSVTNTGFHDVAYRNQDGAGGAASFSGNDWGLLRTTHALTWQTDPQATNQNANALRWGTTYNFRFDADTAPVRGIVTLGPWKKGAPDSVTAAAVVPAAGPFVYECAGDGKSAPCPCGNLSPMGNDEGCLSSLGVGGRLRASGTPSLSTDTLRLACTQVTNGPALYFQGTTPIATPFGNGTWCAGGSIVRLGVVFASGNASAYPTPVAPPIHVGGFVAIGDERVYQAWYRDAGGVCGLATFNFTNTVRATWTP